MLIVLLTPPKSASPSFCFCLEAVWARSQLGQWWETQPSSSRECKCQEAMFEQGRINMDESSESSRIGRLAEVESLAKRRLGWSRESGSKK